MAFINFNGISSKDMNLEILDMMILPRAEQVREVIKVPGRPEPLIAIQKNLENRDYQVVMELNRNSDIHSIYSWLSGQGKLISSDEPDKYYSAIVCDQIDISRINNIYRTITVNFEVGPYSYSLNNAPIKVTSSESVIDVSGNIYCQPIYKISGSGEITLNVGNSPEPLRLRDINEYVTVDTTALMCHKDGVTVWNAGKLPFMAPGTNIIKFSGAVSEIEIVKNERWL